MHKGYVLNKLIEKSLQKYPLVDYTTIKNLPIEDVQVFVKDPSVLDFWSRDYFKLLTDRMAF